MHPVSVFCLIVFPFLCLGSPELRATTWIVDASGGPGHHFTDLPAAVQSAADGDVLRVLPGTYSAFDLAHKGLSIIGDGAASVIVAFDSDVQLGPTSVGQDILIQNVGFECQVLTLAARRLRIQQTGGAVVLDKVELRAAPGLSTFYNVLEIDHCAQVHLHELEQRNDLASLSNLIPLPIGSVLIEHSFVQIESCEITAAPVVDNGDGGTGLDVESSEVFLTGGRIVGGAGRYDPTYTGGRGGRGIHLKGNSRLSAQGRAATIVSGGPGGDAGNPWSPGTGGDGGAGLELVGSTAIFLGFQPQGGAGGSGVPGTNGAPGPAYVTDPSSILAIDTTALPPVAGIPGTPAVGQVSQLELDAEPGASAFVALSMRSGFLPLPPLSGALLLGGGFATGAVSVPPTGRLSFPLLVVPGGAPLDVPVFFQCLTITYGGVPAVSNSAVFLVRS